MKTDGAIPTPPVKRRLAPRLGLSLLAVLVALGVGEAAFRLLLDPPGLARFEQGVELMYGRSVTSLQNILQSDPELFWSLKPSLSLPADSWPFPGVIANRQGLREDDEVEEAKPEGRRRVLFLGDSCTFGYGVAHDEGFVQLVEVDLSGVEGGSLECINAGVPGYTLFQGWRYLETRGLELQPDLVVLCFGWNDMNDWDALSDREHYELLQRARPPAALRWSRICQVAWPALFARRPDRQEARPRLTPQEYYELLGKVHDELESRQVPLVLLNWGFRVQLTEMRGTATAYQAAMRAFARERSLALVDLVPVFDRLLLEHSVSEVFYDGGHVKAMAHVSIAAALEGVIAPWLGHEDPDHLAVGGR